MVYDCIPFFNELDILKLRLNILDPIVDRFIIEEATVTFSGEPKELCFEKNKEMFQEFLPKIEYIVVNNSPKDVTTHVRDNFQKNALERGLKNATPEDVIILSDVDEIPNPVALKNVIAEFDPDKIYHFAQRMFYCFIGKSSFHNRGVPRSGEKNVARNKSIRKKKHSGKWNYQIARGPGYSTKCSQGSGWRMAFRLYGQQARNRCLQTYWNQGGGGRPSGI